MFLYFLLGLLLGLVLGYLFKRNNPEKSAELERKFKELEDKLREELKNANS